MHLRSVISSDGLSRTWAIRPASQDRPREVRRGHASGSSLASSKNTKLKAPLASITDSGESVESSGPTRQKSAQLRGAFKRNPTLPVGGSLAYKPSFTRPMFKWIRGELIGKGSYGRVYMALNATTGELMAVKQVEIPRIARDKLSRQIDIIQAIKFESDTLRDLDHKNIVQYLGYEESPDTLSIFLEYVPGGTIASCLRKHGVFKAEVTKSFTSQILDGLEYLHSRQILHRDLKSENILVETSGVCKISDFGISKKAEEVNQRRAHTEMKGTIYWMAPEVLSPDEKGYDCKVDIWSVGCIVLEMWTAKRPWYGEDLVPVMMKLVSHLSPPLPPDLVLTQEAQNFRELCFQADPSNRPSAAVLKGHSYLRLPPYWLFNSMELTAANRNQPPPSSVNRYQTSSSGTTDESDDDSIARKPSGLKAENFRFGIPPRGPAPPLVVITSSSPPKTRSSIDWPSQQPAAGSASSSDNSKKPGRTSLARQRAYKITNPDSDAEEDGKDASLRNAHTPYIYSPPPLPDPSSTPWSTHLSPPMVKSLGLQPKPQESIDVVSLPLGSPQTASYNYSSDECSDSDSDDDFGSQLWKKPPMLPPPGFRARGPLPIPSFSSNSIPQAKPADPVEHAEMTGSSNASIAQMQGSVWARPDIEDVYQHLEVFFPNHDLDQDLSESDDGLGTQVDDARRKRKSIRKIAEEKVSESRVDPALLRRQTRLWDSRVQEIKN